MKRIMILMLIILCSIKLHSQENDSTASFPPNKSNIKLSIGMSILTKKIEPVKHTRVNFNQYRQVIKNGEIDVDSMKINEQAKKYFDKAEEYFSAMKYDSAIAYYKIAYLKDSTYSNSLVYIGQCYQESGYYKEAIGYLQRAVEKNYIDYMGHWLLAFNYYQTEKYDPALDEICIANILNRNNTKILDDMKIIFLNMGKDYNEWEFSPQVNITKSKDGGYTVATDSNWLMYGLAKVSWKSIPDFAKKHNVDSDPYYVNEECDCLKMQAQAMKNSGHNYDNIPDLKKLSEAYKNNHIKEYTLYEVTLRWLPSYVYLLNADDINKIKNYILNIRYNK
ncbi:MAG TPA: hypothetical protein PK447_06540 [Ignavibacteria bacterium]|nr:hypothetical protein [Ignavibacteria bacterium]